jgi:hypothetical protein
LSSDVHVPKKNLLTINEHAYENTLLLACFETVADFFLPSVPGIFWREKPAEEL